MGVVDDCSLAAAEEAQEQAGLRHLHSRRRLRRCSLQRWRGTDPGSRRGHPITATAPGPGCLAGWRRFVHLPDRRLRRRPTSTNQWVAAAKYMLIYASRSPSPFIIIITHVHVRYMLSPVRLSVVSNVRTPYSAGWNFPQYLYVVWYLGHSLTFTENFTEIVPGEHLPWRV